MPSTFPFRFHLAQRFSCGASHVLGRRTLFGYFVLAKGVFLCPFPLSFLVSSVVLKYNRSVFVCDCSRCKTCFLSFAGSSLAHSLAAEHTHTHTPGGHTHTHSPASCRVSVTHTSFSLENTGDLTGRATTCVCVSGVTIRSESL